MAAGHQLTILLGNHDLELSLPRVRRVLYDALKADRKHQKFIYDGEAYVVGKVLIEHGNRYDGFNVIDHDTLRKLRSNDSRFETYRENLRFSPPPGSLLVSGVMNKIKKDYSFIDLLKPETEAAIPLLLALAPGYQKHLFTIASLIIKASVHEPSADGQPRIYANINSNTNEGIKNLYDYLKEKNITKEQAQTFLQAINTAVTIPTENNRTGISQQIAASSNKEKFKTTRSYLNLLTADEAKPLATRLSPLKTALEVLKNDSSFDRGKEIKKYLEPAKRLLKNDSFDVVIFGHTHLAKRIELEDGLYINTGTWADVMKFPLELLDIPEPQSVIELDQFVKKLGSNEISDYIKCYPTFAQLELAEDGTVLKAELKDV